MLRFAPTLNFNSKDRTGEIAIDWFSCLDLWGDRADNREQDLILKLEPVTGLSARFKAALAHPDPTQRLFFWASFVMAVLGVILGALISNITSRVFGP